MEGTSAHRPPSTFWHSASPQPSSRYGGEEHGPKNTITAFVYQIQAPGDLALHDRYFLLFCFLLLFLFCDNHPSITTVSTFHSPTPQTTTTTITPHYYYYSRQTGGRLIESTSDDSRKRQRTKDSVLIPLRVERLS